VIGIFAPGTHHVLPLLSSAAHHPGGQKKRNSERAWVRARELDGRSERAIERERASESEREREKARERESAREKERDYDVIYHTKSMIK